MAVLFLLFMPTLSRLTNITTADSKSETAVSQDRGARLRRVIPM